MQFHMPYIDNEKYSNLIIFSIINMIVRGLRTRSMTRMQMKFSPPQENQRQHSLRKVSSISYISRPRKPTQPVPDFSQYSELRPLEGKCINAAASHSYKNVSLPKRKTLTTSYVNRIRALETLRMKKSRYTTVYHNNYAKPELEGNLAVDNTRRTSQCENYINKRISRLYKTHYPRIGFARSKSAFQMSTSTLPSTLELTGVIKCSNAKLNKRHESMLKTYRSAKTQEKPKMLSLTLQNIKKFIGRIKTAPICENLKGKGRKQVQELSITYSNRSSALSPW